MAGTTAVALTSCSNNDAQVKQNEENIASVQKQVKTLQENLDAAKAALEESVGKISTYLEIEKVAANGDALASIKKQIADLDTATKNSLTALETAYTAAINAKAAELTQTIETKETALKDQITAITTQIAALGDTYATDEELQTAVADVNAKLGELVKDDEEKVIPVQTQINTLGAALEDVYTKLGEVKTDETTGEVVSLQTQIDNAVKALNDYNTEVANTYATIAELEDKETSLKDLIAAKADKTALDKAIADLNTALGEDAAALTAYKATVESTYATKAALQSVEETLTTTYVTQAIYDEAIATLNAAIGEVKVDEETEKVISLQSQINALETAKATVKALEDLADSFAEQNEGIVASIKDLQAQIGTVKKDDDGKVILTLQAQIDKIIESIGEVEKDEQDNIVSLQDQINALKEQIGDFSGSKELKQIKAELNKDLSGVYADCQDQIEDARYQLIDVYKVDGVENLFRQISKSFNHEMTGYLYEGMTYITLASNATEAEEYYEEYSLLIENFINPALFEINKQVNLNIIKDVETLKYLGDLDETTGEPKEGTIRNKYYQEVKAVEWFDEDTVAELEANPAEYKKQTEALIAKMQLSTSKAKTINAIAEDFMIEAMAITNNYSDPSKFNDTTAKQKFLDLLNEIVAYDETKFTLPKYDACTNAEVEYIDPVTGKTTKITDLQAQYQEDVAKIAKVHEEEIDYLSVNKFADDVFADIEAKLTYLSDADKESIHTAIDKVFKLDDYVGLDKDSKTQLTTDKTAILLINDQATSYNAALKYAADAITTIKDLAYITHPATPADGTSEEEKIIDLINKVAKYANYIGIEGDSAEKALHAAKLTTDKAAIDLIVDQATKYDEVRGYANARNIKEVEEDIYGINYGAWVPATFISASEREDINDLVNAVPVYANYVNNNTIDDETGTYVYLDTYTADKAKLDTYVDAVEGYNNILMYVCDKDISSSVIEFGFTGKEKAVKDILNEYKFIEDVQTDVTPTEKATERETIITLMRAIPDFNNYFGENAVAAETQFNADAAKADLLVARADAFDQIYDAIKGDVTGLETYINSLESGYLYDHDDNLDTDKIDRFTDALKQKFIDQFKNLAVATEYDKVIESYKTIKEFTDYRDSIINDNDGRLAFIKKSAEVYKDILREASEAEDRLSSDETYNMFVGDYDDYNQVFIDQVTPYRDYDIYMGYIDLLNLETPTDLQAWYEGLLVSLNKLEKVAAYENTLLAKVKEVQTAIDTAKTDSKLTADEATYLLAVVDSIYDEYTSVFTTTAAGATTGKAPIAEVAANAIDAPKNELNAVKSAITTIYNVDNAIKVLSQDIDKYIGDQETQFLNRFYKYRDDAKYGGANYTPATDQIPATGKYNFLNQAALEAWNFYAKDLKDKADGSATVTAVKYSYALPTGENYNTYDTFATFMANLETTSQISARYNEYTLWFVNTTDGGKVKEITAKYRTLDGEKLATARTYFLGSLETAYNYYKNQTSIKTYQDSLKSDYDLCVAYISDTENTTTTTMVISYFEDTIASFIATVAQEAAVYKSSKIAEYNAVYSTYQTAITSDTVLADLAAKHNAGLNAFSDAEVDTKDEINAVYAAQVLILTNIYKDYKTDMLAAERTNLKAKDTDTTAAHVKEYDDAYDLYETTLAAVADADLTKAVIDKAYNDAISSFVTTYKNSKKTQLTTLTEAYKGIDEETDSVADLAYQETCDNALVNIEAATTVAAIDENYNTAASALLTYYKNLVNTAIDTEYNAYIEGLDPVADVTLINNYKAVKTEATVTINAITDATKYADVTKEFADAKVGFLNVYKNSLISKLDTERKAYVAYDSTNESQYNAEYTTGEGNINTATTKDAAKAAYDTAAGKFLPLFKTSAETQLTDLCTSYKTKNAGNDQYDAALTTAKNSITAATTGAEVDAAITTAEGAMLATYKTYITGELDTLYNTDKVQVAFDADMIATFETTYNGATTAITAATTEADVTDTYNAAKDAMALIVYKDGKLANLKTEYETYGETPATNVTTEYNNGVTAIKAAKLKDDELKPYDNVDTAYNDAVAAMAAVDLANYKTSKKSALKTASDAGAVANSTFVNEYNAAYASGADAIDAATTKADVDTAFTTWSNNIAYLITDYKTGLKTTGTNSLKAKYDTLKVTEEAQSDELADLLDAYNAGLAAIDAATTKTTILAAYNTALGNMNNCIKDLAGYKASKVALLNECYDDDVKTLGAFGKQYVTTNALTPGKDAVNNAATKADVKAAYEDAVTLIHNVTNIASYKEGKLAELNTYYTGLTAARQTIAANAFAIGNTSIKSVDADTEEKVNTAYNNAVAAIDAAIELDEYKTTVKSTLSGDYAQYGDEPNAATTAYNDGVAAIEAATTKNEVDDEYDAAVAAMLAAYVSIKVDAFDAAYNDYKKAAGSTELLELEIAYDTWRSNINNATSKSDADSKYDSGIAAMESRLATLAEYITARKQDLTDHYDRVTGTGPYDTLDAEEKEAMAKDYSDGLAAIDAATTKAAVDTAYNTAAEAISSYYI